MLRRRFALFLVFRPKNTNNIVWRFAHFLYNLSILKDIMWSDPISFHPPF